MKVVAITQRIDHWPDRHETRDAIDQKLVKWIIQCGFFPLLVPNVFETPVELNRWLSIMNVQGIVFSGGNDIGQISSRDNQEIWLLKWAEDKKIPSLGICRGMQAMACFTGSTLTNVEGHVATHHQISGVINLEVNSFHNYAITNLGDQWDILARSQDDIIEAIQHRALPWEAWMFHPEREPQFNPELQRRFCHLLELKK